MAELTALSPAGALLPKTLGGVRLREADFAPMTGISPHAGEVAQVSSALEAAHGVSLPGPGKLVAGDGAMVMWVGRNRWLLIGPEPGEGPGAHAALTDQSDAWVTVVISGAAGVEVLARLVPVDLRAAMFPEGSVARTEVYHMPAIIARTGAEELRVMCFRSMAGTLVHDLVQAADAVAARAEV